MESKQRMRTVLCVVGTRPEAIKMAPVVKALSRSSGIKPLLLLSGQHRELVDQVLAQFGISADDDLQLMHHNQTLSALTGRAFVAMEERFRSIQPDLVLAQGDTTTVMAAATVSFYLGIPFGHVEAGLRTGDLKNPFPEEFNRVVVGRVATLHFAPTQAAASALKAESVDSSTIVVTGNTVIDNLAEYADAVPASAYRPAPGNRMILLTSHRRENFGDPMRQSFLALKDVVDARPDVSVVYPVHPNPNVTGLAAEIFSSTPRVRLVQPLHYFEFLAAMKDATFIVTDSGGVQEEAPWLSKPVLVLRDETERPEAVELGVAKLIGSSRERLRNAMTELLDDEAVFQRMACGVSPYGDGLASERIVQRIEQFFGLPLARAELAPFTPIPMSSAQ